MGHFPSFEDDADVDFVTIGKESFRVFGFGHQVVVANGDVQLDFLEGGGFGILLLAPFGFLLLITVFAVIEDFANGGIALGGDAEEVEVVTHREFIGGPG